MEDPRFSHVASDPRYKRVSRKRHKVTVDNRFKSMFTDEKFKLNYRVDKRGKEINESSKEDLKCYYNLEEGEEREETVIEGEQEESGLDNSINSNDDSNSDQDDDDSDGSSTDLDYDALLPNDNEIEYDWGDQTGEARRSHDISERLAVCNMNWDRITAQDLFVLFNSFKPQNGVVNSVKIYASEYGKERLANEEREGPAELVDSEDKGEREGDDAIEGPDFAREKLRQYQLNRLKYYYAVVECNNKETAEHIYDQCDGLEYENSASTIDLRFVPVDTVFDEEPSSMATDVTIATDYTPSNFFTSALQQTSVNLTWDETDPSRLKKTMKSFTKEELDDIDFGAYIASSSDEEDQHNGDAYRALLGVGKSSTGSNENKEELQISWNIGLEDEKISKKKGRNAKVKLTDGDQSEEGDDGDLGFDDPFFTDASLMKKKRKKEKLTVQEKEQKEKEKSELELLMMSSDDEEGGKTHFSLKDITAKEKKESGKKKRRKRKLEEGDATNKDEDDFTVDTTDPRFRALYESHLYAVDPTNPQYKETKGMHKILQEKQKQSMNKRAKVSKEEKPTAENSIGVLVKSVKAKAVSYMEKKRRKKHSLIS